MAFKQIARRLLLSFAAGAGVGMILVLVLGPDLIVWLQTPASIAAPVSCAPAMHAVLLQFRSSLLYTGLVVASLTMVGVEIIRALRAKRAEKVQA